MQSHLFISAVVGVILTAAVLSVCATDPTNSVTGSLTVNAQKALLVQPYVDESSDDLIVVLASKEIPRDAVPFIGEELARKQKIHAVVFTVDRAKRALGSTFSGVFYPGTEMGFVGARPEAFTLQLKRLDATGVEGRIFTAKPVTLSDVSYSVDATFSIPLGKAAPPPPPVEVKIAGDTSAPSRAYADYYRAAFAGDVQKIRNAFVAERRAAFDKAEPKEREMLLDLIKMNPAQIVIGKPVIKDTTATLTIEGVNESSGQSTGTITMIQEAGAWKLAQEKWSTSSK
jgi:hypothetical protein